MLPDMRLYCKVPVSAHGEAGAIILHVCLGSTAQDRVSAGMMYAVNNMMPKQKAVCSVSLELQT